MIDGHDDSNLPRRGDVNKSLCVCQKHIEREKKTLWCLYIEDRV